MMSAVALNLSPSPPFKISSTAATCLNKDEVLSMTNKRYTFGKFILFSKSSENLHHSVCLCVFLKLTDTITDILKPGGVTHTWKKIASNRQEGRKFIFNVCEKMKVRKEGNKRERVKRHQKEERIEREEKFEIMNSSTFVSSI